MPENTDARSSVVCGMSYRKAPEAIEWLCRVFGFERHAVYPGPNGTIAHAELTLGGGMIMLGSMKDNEHSRLMKQPDEIGGAETRSANLIVPDADAVYARAKEAGAEIVLAIKDQPQGDGRLPAAIRKAASGTWARTIRGSRNSLVALMSSLRRTPLQSTGTPLRGHETIETMR